MLAKEMMQKNVISVNPDMTLRELAKVLIDRGISGAPVVDESGRLLGVVSQTDLVRRDREAAPMTDVPGFYRDEGKSAYAGGYQIEDPDFTRVRDIMTPAVISATEEASVRQVGSMMLRQHIHRVIITRGGKLCGIVTSMDILRALLTPSPKPAGKA